MHILHFLNHTRPSNGHVHFAVDLACAQSRMGHSVSVVSGGGSFDSIFTAHGIKHVVIDQKRTPSNLFKATCKLRSTLASLRPDIVHAHMAASAGLAFIFRRFMKFKLIAHIHTDSRAGAMVMSLADKVIVVSEAGARNMERKGVRRSKLRVVRNGTIGSARLSAGIPAAKTLNRPAITFVGGLHPRKGVDDLITAFKMVAARVPAAFLYLVGSGPYRDAYQKLASQTGFGDRIVFCGSQSDPRPYLLGSDVFVLASHAEPGALVLAEAREAGCAIIATSVGGVPEMLDDGKAGILVAPGRPDLLADAMTKVLTDEKLLADMRMRASANLDYFTVDRVSKECLSVYESALG